MRPIDTKAPLSGLEVNIPGKGSVRESVEHAGDRVELVQKGFVGLGHKEDDVGDHANEDDEGGRGQDEPVQFLVNCPGDEGRTEHHQEAVNVDDVHQVVESAFADRVAEEGLDSGLLIGSRGSWHFS